MKRLNRTRSELISSTLPVAYDRWRPVTGLLCLAGWLLFPAAPVSGQVAAPVAAAAPDSNSTVVLNPFLVSTSQDSGYRKLSSVTSSRIGVSLYAAPQAIEIIPVELLDDMGMSSIRDAFSYSSSITSSPNEVNQAGSYTLRGFDTPQYINGVLLAANTDGPGYTSIDNVERIEIAKGPTGLFYGNSSPNGVVNTITKKPELINQSTVKVSAGNYGQEKAVVDTQSLVSEKYGLGFRVIGSASKDKDSYDLKESYSMIAGSVLFRPNSVIQITGEFDTTKFVQPYTGVSNWGYMINPLYYQNLANPDSTMIGYIEKAYGAANQTAALQVINNRWGPGAIGQAFLTNWATDYLGAYGKAVFTNTGSTINWNAISPYGSNFTSATPDSNLNGLNRLSDVSVILTPFKTTSVQYHWLHDENDQTFQRLLLSPDPGLPDAQGHLESIESGLLSSLRQNYSDTQQLDLSQEYTIAGIKSTLVLGGELQRVVTETGSATSNQALAGTQTLPGGGTESGVTALQNFYPYSQPYQPIAPLITSGITPVEAIPTKYQDWYVSYRGSLFNDRLNLLAGVRDVKQETTGRTDTGLSHTTKTFGAIGQVLPGLYLFADYSTTFVFNSGYTVAYNATGLPAPDGTPLGPETGKGYEGGLKLSLLQEQITGTVSFFNVQRDGIVAGNYVAQINDPRNLNPNNTAGQVTIKQNSGLQETQGIDGNLIWTPNRNFQFLVNFTWTEEAAIKSDPSVDLQNINISYANAIQYQREFLNRLAKSPVFSSDYVARYNFTGGVLAGVFVGGGVRQTGKFLDTNTSTYSVYVPSEVSLDAFAGYHFKIAQVPCQAKVSLRNITATESDLIHQEGRVFLAELSVRF